MVGVEVAGCVVCQELVLAVLLGMARFLARERRTSGSLSDASFLMISGNLAMAGFVGEGGTDMMVLVGGEGLDGFGSGCNCGVVGEVGADVPVFVGGELPHPLGP